jgi:selenophosphate synthetase-related protein
VQPQQPLLLVTDDQRLRAKVERLSEKFSVPIRILNNPEAQIDALRTILAEIGEVQYIFRDLDATTFDAYLLAHDIQGAFPTIPIIACALVFDPAVVQKSKLHGIQTVLQRFAFEELLRKLFEKIGV